MKCYSCGVEEGQLHDLYCDYEECPFCGGQLSTCDCCYKEFFDYNDKSPTFGLPYNVYADGLPEELEQKWREILNKKGRIPFIIYPNICAKCGKLWPKMFRVSDEEWKHFIAPRQREKIICRPCYDKIKGLILNNLTC